MPTRTLTAAETGPVEIDASLLGHGGTLTIHAQSDCDRATLTITTTDETGPSADAVRDATLRRTGTGLAARVQGAGSSSGTTIVTGGQDGISVVQSFGTVTGTVIGMQVGGGGVFINGVRVDGRSGGTIVQGNSPIDITAIVPEGSSVTAHSESATVTAQGGLADVQANSVSGSVGVDHAQRADITTTSGRIAVNRADDINARSISGAIRLGRTDIVTADTTSGRIAIDDFGGTAHLTSVSGAIRVHATSGGNINATTTSGAIDVTATEAALADHLNTRANSVSGRVRTPQRRTGGNEPRRRR
ncbi:DUF4097 family beta strand repeat-containing protein [Streptomyces sp. NPDC087850]|uniref:DUF4097 family beta strand repeat-containing protein n=1 Tax=Streptomyces sp. NPDC087850 TaxID=3365809 RepID=UPI0038195D07